MSCQRLTMPARTSLPDNDPRRVAAPMASHHLSHKVVVMVIRHHPSSRLMAVSRCAPVTQATDRRVRATPALIPRIPERFHRRMLKAVHLPTNNRARWAVGRAHEEDLAPKREVVALHLRY